jgi:hypothetical protein
VNDSPEENANCYAATVSSKSMTSGHQDELEVGNEPEEKN